jgi:hypothetical protein
MPNAVIVELKQWSGCKGASGKKEVATFVGGNVRDVLHPSAQVGQYMTYLTDCHTAFQGSDSVTAHSCAYIHNYHPEKDDPLFLSQFADQIARSPVFAANNVPGLTAFLDQRIGRGDSGTVAAKVEQSKYLGGWPTLQVVLNFRMTGPLVLRAWVKSSLLQEILVGV